MADYEQSKALAADPGAVFDFLSDPANMPSYVAMMVRARPLNEERVQVAAEVEGRHEEGEARLHADPERRRIEWSGESESGYHGWMQVAPTGGSGSTVTIHLVTDDTGAASEIERALTETLSTIEERVAATG
jgi:uncharacterized protein YndB with AHSA1/START domain